MKRKMTALLLVLALVFTLVPASFAADEAIDVYVTVSDAGELVLTHEAVSVSDLDQDGALTINDTLIAAHNACFEGGSESGFAAVETAYGLSITRLWGVENGGSYGYYLNNSLAMGLLDPVGEGDHLYAFTYADLTAWSDTYSFFAEDALEVEAGETVTLSLSKITFDENYAPVAVPAEASILVGGVDIGVKTAADGSVSLTFDDCGTDCTYYVTASAESLVPAVCAITVRTAAAPVTPAEPSAAVFSDVRDSDWFAEPVKTAAEAGLVVGHDGKFSPEANMTVAEYLTILYRLGETCGMYSGHATTGADWQDAARFLTDELGLDAFDLSAAIRREEMAAATSAFLRALADGSSFVTRKPAAFSDIAESAYADDITFMQGIGVINGYEDGTFRPTLTIRRCEVAAVVANLLQNVSMEGVSD